jgi:hypothetical protein
MEEIMELTGEKFHDVFRNCLYTDDEMSERGEEELMKEAILIEGVVNKIGFNLKRIEINRPAINDLLTKLPDNFKIDKSGGWSFLDACNDISGKQWTGSHKTVDELVCLGLAVGKIEFIFPRDFWQVISG